MKVHSKERCSHPGVILQSCQNAVLDDHWQLWAEHIVKVVIKLARRVRKRIHLGKSDWIQTCYQGEDGESEVVRGFETHFLVYGSKLLV